MKVEVIFPNSFRSMTAAIGLILTGIILAGIAGGYPAVAQPAWMTARCVPTDPTPDQLFDVETALEGVEQGARGWSALEGGQMAKATVKRDASEHHGGNGSLRVDYDFTGKKDYEYILIHGPVEFPQPGKAFGFWLKQDGTPFAIRLRVTDVSGECHQFDMLCSTAAGWQYVACSLGSQSSAWGGDGNKRMDYPCKLDGVLIDRPHAGFVGRGMLWIDEVGLVRKAAPLTNSLTIETTDRRLGNVYAVGDTVMLRASGDGERIRWSATDFFGVELGRGEGPAGSVQMNATLKYAGWFVFKTELVSKERVVAAQLFPCAALAGGNSRSDFFGVCTHFPGYPLETMELLKRYGIDQYRDEISWGAYEAQKGQFAMPKFGAAFLKRSKELGMRPLLIFDYANRHYDNGGYPNSAEAIEAFGRYSVDLIRETRGVVDMFEVWNEWVGGCGMEKRPGTHDGEAYGRLLAPTYKAIKAAFPEVKVVGIGGEYGTQGIENILGAIRTAGTNSMDAWSIHPYRYPHSPELSDLVGEVKRTQEKVAGTGERSKGWVTEIGYPTHRGNGGSDEAAQARYLVRTLGLLQSMGNVEKTFWYDYKDDGLNREYNENNFGLIHHETYNCAPKPGMVAASTYVRMTGGAECKGIDRPESLYVVKYEKKDGAQAVLVWSIYGPRAISLSGEELAMCNLMGGSIPVDASGVVTVTDTPVYITGRNVGVAPKH